MKWLLNRAVKREYFFCRGRFFFSLLCFLVLLLGSGPGASAARIVFYQAENGNPEIEARLTLACRFYGIDLEKISVASDKPPFPAASLPAAIVIEASCLNLMIPSDIPTNAEALLIAGINQKISADTLKKWTGGTIQEPADITGPTNSFLKVSGQRAGIAQQLAGMMLPVDIVSGSYLKGTFDSAIISYPDGRPFFVQSSRQPQPVYLLADLTPVYPPHADIWLYDHGFFAEIAPYMMFLKQTFGEYGWHADGHYANLTIDDPWLRRSYGSLRFSELLKEMDRGGFHTTIAFIPWNYDRPFSPEVIKLFQERPDRFSLCVHGNNHDHQEFYRYEDMPGSRWTAKPLGIHKANIRQGLARMEAFRKTTNLSYDPVMVFPHDISPEPTLELLKKYNFLATFNIGKIPLDAPLPHDPLFWLRRSSDLFGGGLATVDRTETDKRTIADTAIDLFLDNPVLFVEHLLFFANDPAAFNQIAQAVNDIQPDIQWAGPGTIARHLYLLRKEADGIYAVRAFSPEIILRNPGPEQRIYRIEKKDSGNIPVRQLLVDNLPAPCILQPDNYLQLELSIPPGAERHVKIIYQNSFDPEQEDLSKRSLRINTLRRLSEFRDLHLTAGPIGFLMDRLYYGTGFYRLGLEGLAAFALALMLLISLIVIVVKKRRRGRQ